MGRLVEAEIAETRHFVLSSLGASASIFYWIDDAMQMRDASLSGVTAQSFQAYRSDMQAFDPLSVARLVQGRKRVSTLDRDRGSVTRGDFARYASYLGSSGIADVMDLVFWREGRAFAGFGILKTPADPPFRAGDLDLAHGIQRYVEFNLLGHPRLREQALRQRLSETYRLTGREIEVIRLLESGCTNRDIASDLGIALTTVKTHVTRIFDKLGVANRASMVSWMKQAVG